jgi:lycopene cyclase domain-containing protein
MGSYSYLLINFSIIVFPLILSFTKKFYFVRQIKQVALSTFLVGLIFIAWDVVVTKRGHWQFNPEYTLPYRVFGLPIEEILFFITVPYSCLFLYHFCQKYFKGNDRRIGKYSKNILALLFIFLGFITEKEYSMLVLVATGLLLLTLNNKYFTSTHYLIYIFLGFVLFTFFNYLLTSTPIVIYSKQFITGIRLATIPIEDYFYNFILLSFYAKTYDWLSKRKNIQ